MGLNHKMLDDEHLAHLYVCSRTEPSRGAGTLVKGSMHAICTGVARAPVAERNGWRDVHENVQ